MVGTLLLFIYLYYEGATVAWICLLVEMGEWRYVLYVLFLTCFGNQLYLLPPTNTMATTQ